MSDNRTVTTHLAIEAFDNINIKVYGDLMNPLFSANDVASLLNIKNIKANINPYSADEKQTLIITRDSITRDSITRDGASNTNSDLQEDVLTLFGIAKLVFSSKHNKPEARDWVLSMIRKYSKPTELVDQPTTNWATDYKDAPCIYLLYLEGTTYKYGRTDDINGRLNQHKQHFKKYNITPVTINVWKCDGNKMMKNAEADIKRFVKTHNIATIAYDNMTELFTLKADMSIDDVKSRITKFISNVDRSPDKELLTMKVKIAELEKEVAVCQSEKKEVLYQCEKTKNELNAEILKLKCSNEELIRSNTILTSKRPPNTSIPQLSDVSHNSSSHKALSQPASTTVHNTSNATPVSDDRITCAVCDKQLTPRYFKTHMKNVHPTKT